VPARHRHNAATILFTALEPKPTSWIPANLAFARGTGKRGERLSQREVPPVHAGHDDVRDGQVDGPLVPRGELERLLPVAGAQDVVAEGAQRLDLDLPLVRVALDRLAFARSCAPTGLP
jgi:hypothetical protein